MSYLNNETGSFDNWCDLWAKAQEQGIFNDAPKPAVPSSQTADLSYFGASDAKPTEGPSEVDAKYWSQVYNTSIGNDSFVDDEYGVLSEDASPNKAAPNPQLVTSMGMDQEMSKAALGLTFDEEDLKKLEDMKLQLHELGIKLATAFGKGESFSKVESKISNLSKQIDELSTSMTKPYLQESAVVKKPSKK